MNLNVHETELDGCLAVVVSGLENFDIDKIFDCGQCFRFERVENSRHEKEFSGLAHRHFVSFAQDGDILTVYGSSLADFESIWYGYLDLGRDYNVVNKSIFASCSKPEMLAAADCGSGIRILSQEPFETLISFVISQNNNIPRIKKIIEALCAACGERIDVPEPLRKHASQSSSLFAFPTPEAILSLGVEGLRELRVGFRAPYIYDAALRVADGRLSLSLLCGEKETEYVLRELCTVHGVGLKVASCTALFGLHRYNAFPVDVWMKRVAEKYFPEESDLSWKYFGEYAGIAQQYLFYYERYHASKDQ